MVTVVAVAIFMIASLSRSAFFLVTTVTSLSTGHPLHRRKATTTKLNAEENENETASSIVGNWIQTAIETTEAATTITTTSTSDDDTTTTTTHCENNNNNNNHKYNTMFSKINTRFLLVDTKHPGNVGSSARSMKTMGFFPEGLVVVNPHDSRVLGRKKCIDAASGAVDVLEHAVLVVPALEDEDGGGHENEHKNDDDEIENNNSCLNRAVQQAFGEQRDGPILVCGTGMPVDMSHQRKSQRYLEPRKFFERLLGESPYGPASDAEAESDSNSKNTLNIAFVFGNERYGMLPEDMAFCDVVLGIPTHPSFGSLNLATAVQIIAYDWRQALGGFENEREQQQQQQ